MPLKDPQARREYERKRHAKIKADPDLLEKKRKRGREYMRERMKDPVRRGEHVARVRAWQKRDHNGRSAHLRRRYGIDAAAYDAMAAAQNWVCAICKRSERAIDPRTGDPRSLAVDHCHVTRRIRGLLCYNCNVAIGLLKHDAAVLEAAAAYIRST